MGAGLAMFDYDFMQNAFAAATAVALVSGAVGYFLVLRGQTFAGHALSHVGFTGATAAVLFGLSPLWGLVLLTVAAGLGMGLLGERLAQRDVAIGIVLALSLGFGLLFLHFYTAFATQATALLFGNVLAVDVETVEALRGPGHVSLAALAVISRPLLFASVQPELAEAKGVSLRLYSVLFLAIVALATAECAQIVGVLLVFTLMVGPAAAAQRLTRGVLRGVAVSMALALAEAWLGLTLAFYTDWPTSFWISLLSAAVYVAAVAAGAARTSLGQGVGRRPQPPREAAPADCAPAHEASPHRLIAPGHGCRLQDLRRPQVLEAGSSSKERFSPPGCPCNRGGPNLRDRGARRRVERGAPVVQMPGDHGRTPRPGPGRRRRAARWRSRQ